MMKITDETTEVPYDVDSAEAEGLSRLPPLNSLKKLECYNCPSLLSLPRLLPTALQTLVLFDCASLTSLPLLPVCLRVLACSRCPNLSCLPPLPSSLLSLECTDCPLITSLPPLPSSLRELCFSDLPLPPPPSLSKLIFFNYLGEKLPPFPEALELLICQNCPNLVCLTSALSLFPDTLVSLVCINCPQLRYLSALPRFGPKVTTGGRKVEAILSGVPPGCKSRRQLLAENYPARLVLVRNCEQLKTLNKLPMWLSHLICRDCPAACLPRVSEFLQFPPQLVSLDISGCPQMPQLPRCVHCGSCFSRDTPLLCQKEGKISDTHGHETEEGTIRV